MSVQRRTEFPTDPNRIFISVDEADALLGSIVSQFPTERIPLSEARGRVLRETIVSDRDLPPRDRVAMDGIAITEGAWAAGNRNFRIVGLSPAGAPQLRLDDPASCIQVMTGAVLPAGADLIIPVEDLQAGTDNGWARVLESAAAVAHVHRQGSDRKAGEVLVKPGVRLAERHIGILAAVGAFSVIVSSRPAIAVAPTGDELVPVESSPLPHQIRASNDLAIAAALAEAGYSSTIDSPLIDDRDLLRADLKKLLEFNTVLILTGGVSAGALDFVPSVLQDLGVRPLFHKVRQRPGKPLWVGLSETDSPTVVFGLPGNPVSALIGTIRYIVPYLRSCSGDEGADRVPKATLTEPFSFDKDLSLFLPVRLESSTNGLLRAEPAPTNGSGDFAALADADGFLELPAEMNEFEAGYVAGLYRFGGNR